ELTGGGEAGVHAASGGPARAASSPASPRPSPRPTRRRHGRSSTRSSAPYPSAAAKRRSVPLARASTIVRNARESARAGHWKSIGLSPREHRKRINAARGHPAVSLPGARQPMQMSEILERSPSPRARAAQALLERGLFAELAPDGSLPARLRVVVACALLVAAAAAVGLVIESLSHVPNILLVFLPVVLFAA